MALVDYAYSNTRIRVMKSQLLGEKELESLARAKSPEDFIASLKQTYYGESMSGLDKADVREVEKHLRIELLRAVRKVLRVIPDKCEPFLEALARRYELEVVKFSLNSRASGSSEKLDFGGEELFSGEGEECVSKLCSLPSEEMAPSLLKAYPGLEEFLGESSDTLSMLLALDKYYFSELAKAVKTLKGSERKAAEAISAVEADAANIMTVLRAVSRGSDPKRFLIPGKGKPEELIADDVAGVVKKLSATAYGPLLEEPLATYSKTGSFLPVELALRRHVARQYASMMAKYPMRFDFILGYMKRKELEVENLRAAYVGIVEGMPYDKLSDVLVMPA